jgi:hypothetical protein
VRGSEIRLQPLKGGRYVAFSIVETRSFHYTIPFTKAHPLTAQILGRLNETDCRRRHSIGLSGHF